MIKIKDRIQELELTKQDYINASIFSILAISVFLMMVIPAFFISDRPLNAMDRFYIFNQSCIISGGEISFTQGPLEHSRYWDCCDKTSCLYGGGKK